MKPLELWGGVECTHNRVGDRYFDQLTRSGHADRLSDLDRFHQLGLRTLRYPVLWERVAPYGVDRANWTWVDERLHRLRELGIRPIVGLVHHGSGPRWTSLLEHSFVNGLAEFAAAVAERYPWIDAYTPVNEPLTTARFSALYGHWYPHQRNDRAFIRALVNQVLAIRAAMKAVRRVNPAAQLVQTEDIGLIRSTARLRYQAAFENHRRWLSFDLLTARVDETHPMWPYLRGAHVDEAAIASLRADPCLPDVLGLNYYLTSDRYLDHRVHRHPDHVVGGNGRHSYVDLEAVRVRRAGLVGHDRQLLDTWSRYRVPVAITEVHAGCSREEQARWLHEAWHGAHAARAAGAEVVAVTVWSLLGSYDWNTLVTRDAGHYEPGVFDARSPEPRPTLLASLVTQLSQRQKVDMPVLQTPGWWRRASRYGGPPSHQPARSRCILITGARGTLGQEFGRACAMRGLSHALLTRAELDIADRGAVARAIARYRPMAIVNAAGFVDVDRAEREPERCRRENTLGPTVLAQECAKAGVRLLTFSSDLVFDGAAAVPYVESTASRPLNVYGQSKADAERQVLATFPQALVVRTSAFFGPHDDFNFITVALRHCAQGLQFRAAKDVVVSPTYVPELAAAALDLLLDEEEGIWHLANPGAITWAELATHAVERAGLDVRLVEPVAASDLGWAAPRPTFSALGSERGLVMQSLDVALDQYWAAMRPALASTLQSSLAGGSDGRAAV